MRLVPRNVQRESSARLGCSGDPGLGAEGHASDELAALQKQDEFRVRDLQGARSWTEPGGGKGSLVEALAEDAEAGAVPPEGLEAGAALAEENEDVTVENVASEGRGDHAPESVVMLAQVGGLAMNEAAPPSAREAHEASLWQRAARWSRESPSTRAPPGSRRVKAAESSRRTTTGRKTGWEGSTGACRSQERRVARGRPRVVAKAEQEWKEAP
jgi:hypothetical protein